MGMEIRLLTSAATSNVGQSKLSMNRMTDKMVFSSSPREERVGRGLRRGAFSIKNMPPLPNPLLPPTSGREGDALRFMLATHVRKRVKLFPCPFPLRWESSSAIGNRQSAILTLVWHLFVTAA
jgi:hypothetical protein